MGAELLTSSPLPAVLAIEAPMQPAALACFTEVFYTELMRSGLADLAVARARAAIFVPAQWDWTAPTLYARTQDLQIVQQVSQAFESTVKGVRSAGDEIRKGIMIERGAARGGL